MNIKEIQTILINGGIEPNEAKIEAKMLVKHFLNLSDKDLIINGEFEARGDLLEAANLRAQKRIPIQHIIGFAHFMGENFIVNKNVLIPRDETEILVRKAIEIINKNCLKKVLDIGTGSGCIACVIAKSTSAQVIGIDVSNEALSTSLDNASKLNLFNQAIFRKSDLFSNIKKDEKFDIIISNPPYIPISKKETLQTEVQFDPMLALFAKNDGLEFYEKIIAQSPNFLNQKGYLIFECGINQAKKIRNLMYAQGFFNIEVIQDLSGIDRVVVGQI